MKSYKLNLLDIMPQICCWLYGQNHRGNSKTSVECRQKILNLFLLKLDRKSANKTLTCGRQYRSICFHNCAFDLVIVQPFGDVDDQHWGRSPFTLWPRVSQRRVDSLSAFSFPLISMRIAPAFVRRTLPISIPCSCRSIKAIMLLENARAQVLGWSQHK